jgi:hypothetical protein
MRDIIKIAAPFSGRYTLVIDSDLKAINATMNSKTQIRWDFRVLKLHESYFEAELLQLDNILLEANNPLIKEIASLTQVLGRMYNELYLQIDYSGNILNVLNSDFIFGKWQQTKSEIQKIAENTPELQGVIALNDYIFTNPEKLKSAIQASEFFLVYFNKMFGNYLPYSKGNIQANNFFNTQSIHWDFRVAEDESGARDEKIQTINIAGKPSYPLQKEFHQKAYSQFAEQIDVASLKTDMWEKSIYKIERKTGKVQEAVLQRAEIADQEKLFTKITYSLACDSN